MNWRDEAMKVYEREPCAHGFWEDYQAHLLTGYAFQTPGFFCMGRAVMRDAPIELLLDPWHHFDEQEADAWLVWLVAGDMAKAWACFPSSKPWIGFQRLNRLRWRKFDRMQKAITLPHGKDR